MYQLQSQNKSQNANRFSPFPGTHGQGSGASPSNCNSSLEVAHHLNNQQQSSPNSGTQKPFHPNGAQLQQQVKLSLTSSPSGPTLTASDLSMILERKELTTKIAEDIINTLVLDAGGSLGNNIPSHCNNNNNSNITAINPTNSLADLVNSSSSSTFTTNTSSSSSTMSGIESEPSHHHQHSPSHHTHPMRSIGVRSSSSQIKFSPQMTASQLVEAASKWDKLTLNLLSDHDEPPLPPDPPYPPLPRDKLLPPTPSVFVS